MKVDGPNIGKYFIIGTFEGVRIKDTIVKYIPESLIETLEEFAEEIYRESYIILYDHDLNFVQENEMYVITSGSMEAKGNREHEGVYINMRFYIDDNGNVNSITIKSRVKV